MKLLVIEDDPRLCDLLRRGLCEDGHVVEVETDGVAGEASAGAGDYDAIVLDVMLPQKDGLSILRALRERGTFTPVLLVTARDALEDVIEGLDAGADDYVRKPFAFAEFEARLRSIARRKPHPVETELRHGDLVIALGQRRARYGQRPIAMTVRELAFLEYFLRNAGLVLTRAMLESAMWNRESETISNVIDVYVRRLRAKLAEAGAPPLLHTVRGAGYRFGEQ